MYSELIVKAIVVWVLIVVMAIFNGLIRESVWVHAVGEAWALPISGIILSLLVLLITYLSIEWMGCLNNRKAYCVGTLWLLMTLAFEFLFGHYVLHKSWAEIFQVFSIHTGNLFSLVLIVCLVGPRLILTMK